jgi:hypothetical protein
MARFGGRDALVIERAGHSAWLLRSPRASDTRIGPMKPTDELTPVILADGSKVEIAVSYREGFVITRIDAMGVERARIHHPYPMSGFGGGGTLLSPTGRYLVVHYFSGQSEETFFLIDVRGGLDLVASPAFLRGQSASYAFSSDESRLVMALPESNTPWWEAWEDDEITRDEHGNAFGPFAKLVACDCRSGHIELASVDVVFDSDERPPISEDAPDLDPRFSSRDTLRIAMPWGDTIVPAPRSPDRLRFTISPR